MFDSVKKLLALRKLQGLWKKKDLTSQKWWKEFIETALKIPEVKNVARDIMEGLKGYKTYIMAAAIAATVLANKLGYLDDTTANTILGLLGAGAVATVGAKVNRNTVLTEVANTKINALLSDARAVNQAAQIMRNDRSGITGGTSNIGNHPADQSINYGRTPRK